MRKTEIEDYVEERLTDVSFEELLEEFNLTATEVFVLLFESGHIDEELVRTSINDL